LQATSFRTSLQTTGKNPCIQGLELPCIQGLELLFVIQMEKWNEV